MEKKTLARALLPLGLVLVLLVDGQISNQLRAISDNFLLLNSHLFLLSLLFCIIKMKKKYMMVVAALLGMLYDSYYYSILGINMLIFPLIVWLIYIIFDYVEPTLFSVFLCFILMIALVDTSSFLLQLIFQLIKGDTLVFVTRNLGPTLLFNMVLFVVGVIPMKKKLGIK